MVKHWHGPPRLGATVRRAIRTRFHTLIWLLFLHPTSFELLLLVGIVADAPGVLARWQYTMAVPPLPAEPPVPSPSSPTSSLSPSIPPAPADPESIDLYLLSLLPASANDPSTLRSDLREHLSSLRNQLTELINEDYEEFISLGRGLRGEKERLDGLLEPLEGIKTEVSKVKVEVEKSVVELEGGLAGREVGRSEKALLDLLSRLFVTASRAQALLPDSTANSSNGLSVSLANGLSNGGPEDKGSEERIKQVQRAAAEWRELVYLLEKCRVEQCDAADEVQPVSLVVLAESVLTLNSKQTRSACGCWRLYLHS